MVVLGVPGQVAQVEVGQPQIGEICERARGPEPSGVREGGTLADAFHGPGARRSCSRPGRPERRTVWRCGVVSVPHRCAGRAEPAPEGSRRPEDDGRPAGLVELRGFEPLTFSLRRLRPLVWAGLPRCIRCDCCLPRKSGGAQGVRETGPPEWCHRPDSQPTCSAVSGVKGGRRPSRSDAVAPLMPGAGVHILGCRDGGESRYGVSGGVREDGAERRPQRGGPPARAEGALEPVRKLVTALRRSAAIPCLMASSI